ncbi:Mph(E)/Mph(G) family macrolide 2'-phosphotransferase [Sphingobacterium alkalisoli]|uniref:Mph(E)/Mph(G) family macrolide 2'-phosphotransferase n=1 Tax=Sphingobacterium alkalisoli TaxID=1874115 RepID=A0A4U0H3W4_9SPHI|nr:Mph(E)/Mph(G) family macrolide 2'-phosphotransferase [Sphingobacterium alkalisoli]TJY65854.1 Mph(E)/Mph(G) family macrolide 2'-phosphotransferase [Sphingobacterium alkalisoli]GGH17848.1 Mph(B) family macrolide 2'-phosphotransferase [Sphingobacterium alkalisoli]
MTPQDIQHISKKHGLALTEEISFNDMGIDFKVAFATDTNGQRWVLRMPRRDDLGEQVQTEQRILDLVSKHLVVQVPEWKIVASDMIAYPLLRDLPVLSFDGITYEVTWNMDQHNPNYVPSLAKVLADLHNIPRQKIQESDLKVLNPEDLRTEIEGRLKLVKSELGINNDLENRYKTWLDNDRLWPDYTRFIHGDLYAGHVMADSAGTVSGVIDWSTAHVGDISLDFSGHLSIFGEESLKALIIEYEKNGGQVWDTLFEQTLERAAAAPLAYGLFAVETQIETHIIGAKAQLGVE